MKKTEGRKSRATVPLSNLTFPSISGNGRPMSPMEIDTSCKSSHFRGRSEARYTQPFWRQVRLVQWTLNLL
jgi:hypothetical protein